MNELEIVSKICSGKYRGKKVEEMIKKGFVKRVFIANEEKLGFKITAVIEVGIKKGYIDEAERNLANFPNVKAVYDVTGDYDAILIAKFRDMKELNNFIKVIHTYPYVESTRTHVVLNIVKEKPSVFN